MEACPCDLGQDYKACCGRYHSGELPPTASALMRSRYSAFVLNDSQYIKKTMHGQALAEHNQGQRSSWGKKDTWQKLELIDSSCGTESYSEGSVEFKAYYERDGVVHVLHEKSQFVKIKGQWLYCSGEQVVPKIEQAVSGKVARNDPCPCASGKKYKKCCGG
jgi:SEC-C motif domain protein